MDNQRAAAGFTSGDHLSSYLFILYTEALVANIKKAEREKLSTGIKIARACPPIFHLFFADEFFLLQNKKWGISDYSQNPKGIRSSFRTADKLWKIFNPIWAQDWWTIETRFMGYSRNTKFRWDEIIFGDTWKFGRIKDPSFWVRSRTFKQ